MNLPTVDEVSATRRRTARPSERGTAPRPAERRVLERRVLERRVLERRVLERRVPELDGVRGCALVLVVIFHYVVAISGAAPGSPLAYFLVPLRLAWSGVDLFFVLSGFLIGGILMKVRDAPNYFHVFYVRRTLRIMPLYYAVLVAFVAGVEAYRSGLLPVAWLFEHTPFVWAYPVFLQNILMATVGMTGLNAFSASWSVAVEEQFYLTLPLLIRFVRRTRMLVLSLAGMILAAGLFRTALMHRAPNWEAAAYVLLPARMDALATGVLLAVAYRSPAVWNRLRENPRRCAGTLAVLSTGLAVLTLVGSNGSAPVMTTVGYTWLAAFYGSCIAAVLLFPHALPARAMRARWLRHIGELSYGLYLLHIPALGLCHYVLRQAAPVNQGLRGLGATLTAVGMTYAAARLSYRYFERPLVALGHRFRYQTA